MSQNVLKLTKRAIEAIPPAQAGTRVVYHDPETPGFQLRVSASGAKTFCWYARPKGGEPVRATIGRYPAIMPEQARAQAVQFNAQAVQGMDPAAKARMNLKESTFADLFKEYMERYAKGKKTADSIRKQYERHLSSPLGSKKISQVTRQLLADLNSRIGQTRPTTANRVMEIVSSVFNRAIEWGRCETNPAEGIRAFPEKSRKRFLQPHEMRYFFDALLTESSETMRDFFFISLLTGVRRSNVLEMQWNEVNFEAMEWHIPETKNGEPLNVHLVPEVLATLKARKKANRSRSPYVFPGEGNTGHLVEPKAAWKRICRRGEAYRLIEMIAQHEKWDARKLQVERLKAGSEKHLTELVTLAKALNLDTGVAVLETLRIHDLRRSLGSWQARSGASLPMIGRTLGHKSIQATAIYAQIDQDPVRQSVQKATSAMLEAGGVGSALEE